MKEQKKTISEKLFILTLVLLTIPTFVLVIEKIIEPINIYSN